MREIETTQEDIDAVPSGDPGQWEISMRELCQEIEKLPASEQQTTISVKASAIYQSLAEFNRYCEAFFDAAMFEKLCNFMNTHAFQPGDPEQGWENQCSVLAPDGLRHCGGYREDHPMSATPNTCPHLHTKRLVLPASKRKQFDEPFAYHCTDCNRTFGEEPVPI